MGPQHWKAQTEMRHEMSHLPRRAGSRGEGQGAASPRPSEGPGLLGEGAGNRGPAGSSLGHLSTASVGSRLAP